MVGRETVTMTPLRTQIIEQVHRVIVRCHTLAALFVAVDSKIALVVAGGVVALFRSRDITTSMQVHQFGRECKRLIGSKLIKQVFDRSSHNQVGVEEEHSCKHEQLKHSKFRENVCADVHTVSLVIDVCVHHLL
jgi:hypothetical protein